MVTTAEQLNQGLQELDESIQEIDSYGVRLMRLITNREQAKVEAYLNYLREPDNEAYQNAYIDQYFATARQLFESDPSMLGDDVFLDDLDEQGKDWLISYLENGSAMPERAEVLAEYNEKIENVGRDLAIQQAELQLSYVARLKEIVDARYNELS